MPEPFDSKRKARAFFLGRAFPQARGGAAQRGAGRFCRRAPSIATAWKKMAEIVSENRGEAGRELMPGKPKPDLRGLPRRPVRARDSRAARLSRSFFLARSAAKGADSQASSMRRSWRDGAARMGLGPETPQNAGPNRLFWLCLVVSGSFRSSFSSFPSFSFLLRFFFFSLFFFFLAASFFQSLSFWFSWRFLALLICLAQPSLWRHLAAARGARKSMQPAASEARGGLVAPAMLNRAPSNEKLSNASLRPALLAPDLSGSGVDQ